MKSGEAEFDRGLGLLQLDRIEVRGEGRGRELSCPYCNEVIKRTLTPHLREVHPTKWDKWCLLFVYMYNNGLSVKQIMRRFSSGGRLICTWGVIENEIRRLSETKGTKLRIPPERGVGRWKPTESKLERTTVWSFKDRGSWAVHTNDYRGNWSPYIPRNVIRQYTKKGDWILDGFVGGGTSLIESWLLGRNCIGTDISTRAIAICRKRLRELERYATKAKHKLPRVRILTKEADARSLGFISDRSIDLVCSHPPYADALRYTNSTEGDLSRISNVDDFCDEMEKVGLEFNRVLKLNKRCAILMGDIRKENMVVPLAYKVLERFLGAGFVLEDIIIKTQHHDRSTEFFEGKPRTKFRFRISHEYLFVMRKSEDVTQVRGTKGLSTGPSVPRKESLPLFPTVPKY